MKSEQDFYDDKIRSAETNERNDAVQALRDVEDAICAAKNLHNIYGADIVGTAGLILNEAHRRRNEKPITEALRFGFWEEETDQ